jgi:hypothetical protein
MGQLFKMSNISALEDMMVEKVENFIQALHEKGSSPVQVVRACRALDADVICKFEATQGVKLSTDHI